MVESTVIEPDPVSGSYIPASRHELIDALCRSAHLSTTERTQFRQFCEILTAYAHFTSQKDLELMKFAFSHFDPNADGPRQSETDNGGREDTARVFIEAFDRTAGRANFRPLEQETVRAALNRASIIPVQTAVDFDDFAYFGFYYRASNTIQLTVRRWWRKKIITVGNYDRMAVLLQVKESDYFSDQGEGSASPLIPGKMYLNLYKNIPHHDLELLFPNLKISMTLKDKLMLAIPAFGAAVPLVLKILPSAGLLIGAIALVVFGWELGGDFAIDDSNQKAIYALLTALLSISLALGGFAAGQYVKYKSRRLEFLKKVADVLFFKSLDVGKGVLNALIDSAEEEECKEMMLVFHVLLVNQGSMDEQAVDVAAEKWLLQTFGTKVDFDVAKALESLAAIRGSDDSGDASIVTRGDGGAYRAVTIEQAKARIDRIWDNTFRY